MLSRALPLLLVLMTSAACQTVQCDDDFEEGERFQLTILGQDPAYSSCGPTVPSLSVGDAVILTAGSAVMETEHGGDGDSWVCNTRGASADTAPFLAGTLTSCTTAQYRLGLTCTGADASGCGLSVTAHMSAIPDGAAVVERGTYLLTWSNDCASGACVQQYDVRIERLGTPSRGS